MPFGLLEVKLVPVRSCECIFKMQFHLGRYCRFTKLIRPFAASFQKKKYNQVWIGFHRRLGCHPAVYCATSTRRHAATLGPASNSRRPPSESPAERLHQRLLAQDEKKESRGGGGRGKCSEAKRPALFSSSFSQTGNLALVASNIIDGGNKRRTALSWWDEGQLEGPVGETKAAENEPSGEEY